MPVTYASDIVSEYRRKVREDAPKEVLALEAAIEANARSAGLELPAFVSVNKEDDGSWVLCDNYERYFLTMYVYEDGQWFVRQMYSDTPRKPYSFERAMQDASMMYTG